MDEANIRFLAHVEALVTERAALEAEIAGMVAHNKHQEMIGESGMYEESTFAKLADKLCDIAIKLFEL